MARSNFTLVAFALVLCGACGAWVLRNGYAGDGKDAAPKAGEMVSAKRYKTRVVMDATHGASAWIEELFFPDKGVCANIETKVEVRGKELEFPHVLNAFYGPMRNKFRMEFRSEVDSESPVEDVRVPASVAAAIFEAADLNRRLDRVRRDIGPRVSELALCHDLDEDGKPRAKAAQPAPPAPDDEWTPLSVLALLPKDAWPKGKPWSYDDIDVQKANAFYRRATATPHPIRLRCSARILGAPELRDDGTFDVTFTSVTIESLSALGRQLSGSVTFDQEYWSANFKEREATLLGVAQKAGRAVTLTLIGDCGRVALESMPTLTRNGVENSNSFAIGVKNPKIVEFR